MVGLLVYRVLSRLKIGSEGKEGERNPLFWTPVAGKNDSLGRLKRVGSFTNEAEQWLGQRLNL